MVVGPLDFVVAGVVTECMVADHEDFHGVNFASSSVSVTVE